MLSNVLMKAMGIAEELASPSEVKFEGSNGGTWVSVTERSRGFVVSVGFGREEVDWFNGALEESCGVGEYQGIHTKVQGRE
ncbi:hypothetical protein CK203_046594 [Vitis vinifera]|uniref:Uncharacterized protein n=1 Tax=Vitis vinifera TaxID=29760 RepID=A0A438HLH2_VITVI|nr:hypothetical protein CK203_046594 [Vitis vinifera]